ncbi:hypothetical protein [Parapedobacter indicus]|uniref:Uncharacterized protein n=1 Tax=Parapedobacter indicus TaxID=1477437 RepID=A0A1I3IGJ5_9SPHI|nr:hypothetical protein [Parapedobacter indicus]PPL02153.1 hypothetical protein CLV26_10478 [Parapedobacter indicus]SFI46913.1 hypothetical protein SAMN05444682_10478 [Parapedobacter indicus]
MELNVKIGFNELLAAIKGLPDSQLAILKKELDKKTIKPATTRNKPLKELLLKGPIFEKDQLMAIAEIRKSINQWRTP